MTAATRQPELSSNVQTLLARLRSQIRRYLWIQAVAWLVAWTGAAFWLSLAADWFFEPPPLVRGSLLVAAFGFFAWFLVEMIGRRAWVRLSDRSMAVLLERRFPQFNESLITAVERTGSAEAALGCDAEMLGRTCRLAAEPVDGIDTREVFNPLPLRRSVAAALVATLSIGVLAVASPETLGVWARRSLGMSEELWPRKTELTVEGFADGTAKVARGADLTIKAQARLDMPWVPAVVKVRYRASGGPRRQEIMARLGAADPAKEQFQDYTYTFQSVLAPIRFDVAGGDDAVRDLAIEVVDNPTLIEIALDCRYPDYMAREPQRLPVAGAMPIPIGTEVTVRARANKDLVAVRVESAGRESVEPLATLSLDARSDPRAFDYTLDDFQQDQILLFTLDDVDGITSRQPVRLTLVAIADEAPQLAVRLMGIGSAVTPQARLPVAGRISDDYGLARVWFEHGLEGKPASEVPIVSPQGNPTELLLDEALDVRDLGLEPGDRLLLHVEAADRVERDEGPNVGSSERWLLDVVTPGELRTILESRELVLRQRFEAILTEVTDTRDLLAQIELESGKATPDEAEPAERLQSLRKLRVERAAQNSRKDAHEITALARAFEDIREELVNNRIDTEELKIRLQQGIADPLRHIADGMFPALERELDALLKTLDDGQTAEAARDRVVVRFDEVLASMRRVLARMIELEDFNEAIALLREIIEAQQRINQRTEQEHRGGIPVLPENSP